MAEIINLRQVRKARDKAKKAAQATENRTLFGRPKAAKALTEKRAAIEVTRLDAHKIEGPDKG